MWLHTMFINNQLNYMQCIHIWIVFNHVYPGKLPNGELKDKGGFADIRQYCVLCSIIAGNVCK